jgi:adenine deaminase
MLEQLIERIPKAELHIHIEGSLEPELMFELGRRNQLKVPYESADDVRKAYEFTNLHRFLTFIIRGSRYCLRREISTI